MQELEQHRWRVYVLSAILITCAAFILGKLISLQVLQNSYYSALAKDEHWLSEEIPAERGTLFDNDGYPLATSVTFDALYVDTKIITDTEKVASQLSSVLNGPTSAIRDKLAVKQAAPMLVKEGLSYANAEAIRKLKLSGCYLLPRPRRDYPEGSLAAQTLGLVGKDNQGLSGIEAYLNKELSGKPGVVLAERDTQGDAIGNTISEYQMPERGNDVVLTIDRFIQRIAERELEKAISSNQAKGGSVVVLDPKNGAVLAIANRPTFSFDDPQLFAEDKMPLYRNAAVSDNYEPGSVFKIVTMSAGLDSGSVTADESYYNPGSFKYGGGTVRNALSRPPGPESMTQILQRSSNIGAAYVATNTGASKFYRYVKAFGFGEPTNIEMLGEASGFVRTPEDGENWCDFDLATNSFGQGIMVTPIQMAAATATIANGGTLIRPTIIKGIKNKDGLTENAPVVLRQVISPSTAKTVATMMVATIENTEGGIRESYLKGYHLGGKSGTAEIADEHGYKKDVTITSFTGFGPAENPRFVILVKVVEPQVSPWAENVAAPAFREIAREILNHYGIAPTTP